MWRIPAIRGRIGNWNYYTSNISFAQISEYVTASVNEIYQADSLDYVLQRNLTENYNAIKEYILNDSERFFNAIILAIFEGDPRWLEVEFEEREYSSVGFLEFRGDEQIFPIDGQHRVKGIQEAVTENPELLTESVPVVFVAHYQTQEGRTRTRKLFSTLNRRAKPVGPNENIALDEDDMCAIITRDLMQTIPLFMNANIGYTKGKQLPANNEVALTSIISLYQSVCSIIQRDMGLGDSAFKKKLLFRPSETEIHRSTEFVHAVFEDFASNTTVIAEYLQNAAENKAANYRNKQGGNILFRPIVFPIYFEVALMISKAKDMSLKDAFCIMNRIPQALNERPWLGLLWDGSKIINRTSHAMIKIMLLYMTCSSLLSHTSLDSFVESYAKVLSMDAQKATEYLAPFRDCGIA